jgi:hypothetical protein
VSSTVYGKSVTIIGTFMLGYMQCGKLSGQIHVTSICICNIINSIIHSIMLTSNSINTIGENDWWREEANREGEKIENRDGQENRSSKEFKSFELVGFKTSETPSAP